MTDETMTDETTIDPDQWWLQMPWDVVNLAGQWIPQDDLRPVLACIHVNLAERRLEGADGFVLKVVNLEQKLRCHLPGNFLIPGEAIRKVRRLLREGDLLEVTEFGGRWMIGNQERDTWMLFTPTDGTFPDVASILEQPGTTYDTMVSLDAAYLRRMATSRPGVERITLEIGGPHKAVRFRYGPVGRAGSTGLSMALPDGVIMPMVVGGDWRDDDD